MSKPGDVMNITIQNPVEMIYAQQTGELSLTGVDTLGRRYQIRLDPYATRAVSSVLVGVMQLNGGLLGKDSEGPAMH